MKINMRGRISEGETNGVRFWLENFLSLGSCLIWLRKCVTPMNYSGIMADQVRFQISFYLQE